VAKRQPKKSAGTDEIPSFFILDLICELARPLCDLFNASLVQGTYPNRCWKEAKMCQIGHKKGDREDLENYIPIALICGFSKLFERLLYDYLIREVKPLLSPNQHGFLGGRSIATNLTCFTQFTSDTIDKQGQIVVAYTDFSKAFNKINHSILLLRKFSEFGLTEQLILFFQSPCGV